MEDLKKRSARELAETRKVLQAEVDSISTRLQQERKDDLADDLAKSHEEHMEYDRAAARAAVSERDELLREKKGLIEAVQNMAKDRERLLGQEGAVLDALLEEASKVSVLLDGALEEAVRARRVHAAAGMRIAVVKNWQDGSILPQVVAPGAGAGTKGEVELIQDTMNAQVVAGTGVQPGGNSSPLDQEEAEGLEAGFELVGENPGEGQKKGDCDHEESGTGPIMVEEGADSDGGEWGEGGGSMEPDTLAWEGDETGPTRERMVALVRELSSRNAELCERVREVESELLDLKQAAAAEARDVEGELERVKGEMAMELDEALRQVEAMKGQVQRASGGTHGTSDNGEGGLGGGARRRKGAGGVGNRIYFERLPSATLLW